MQKIRCSQGLWIPYVGFSNHRKSPFQKSIHLNSPCHAKAMMEGGHSLETVAMGPEGTIAKVFFKTHDLNGPFGNRLGQ